ncbi:hypothetical protein [Reichenbachiella sp. MALMAid0571]|uniref:hypothetical protein n=1 Tax=Reichenbachiella sp. MALMAid0571 TaxID=3143939 RepID=UPI0032E03D30
MHKTILIPIDFSVKSLNLLRSTLEKESEEPVNIVLSCGHFLGTSITELLFFSKEKLLDELINPEFKASLEVIYSKYNSQISNFSIEIFTGNSVAGFINFLEGNRINRVYINPDYTPKFKNKNSFDLMPYIKKSRALVYHVQWAGASRNHVVSKSETVADIFFREMVKS